MLVRNEQNKLLATAVNNLGIASVVTGVIAPMAGYILGSLAIDDPLRLASFVVVWDVHRRHAVQSRTRHPGGAHLMRMTDLVLFGPPLLLGAFGWGLGWLSARSDRRYRDRHGLQGPAE